MLEEIGDGLVGDVEINVEIVGEIGIGEVEVVGPLRQVKPKECE